MRIRYDYDNDGHIIRGWLDNRLYGTFEYEGNILTKVTIPPNDSDPERTFPVTFADGMYQAMDGSIRFRMDDRQHLVYDDAIRDAGQRGRCIRFGGFFRLRHKNFN